MIIFPAIDIKDGRVVRLLQGKFDRVTQYSKDPVSTAKYWQEKGAEWIHVVDLDGALTGKVKNFETIKNIVEAVDVPIQIGGGIREEKDIEKLIDAGVSRVILGTKVANNIPFLEKVTAKWPDKIAVSLDCSDGIVLKKGWTSSTNIKAIDLVKDLNKLNISCIIYTDVATDGMMSGPNFKALEELIEKTNIPIIASGGVSNLKDLDKLAKLEDKGVMGAITGKAIYEGRFDLKEAIQITRKN
ncbi:MAG: 1-(5-phosphoribosyl)-5-[(5-phosphoribosylamino)methylideneamino]imidazole-4-carboxamide isomerase [Candidatus Zapsychrus exili]|nr:1-(5-phosphoribosyl)-5-[(5-phosphoribosylamino)methylideneamino]imidazole-4-carboxamide isomerase [Candidatus Zapsychrus exili]